MIMLENRFRALQTNVAVLVLMLIFLSLIGCSYTENLTTLTRKQASNDIDYLAENVTLVSPMVLGGLSRPE